LGVTIEYGEWKGHLHIPFGFRKVVREIGLQEKRKLGEICFIFVSDTEILRINTEFLKHDYITDVITFSNSMRFSLGGDIFICPKMVFINADSYGSDNYTELFRVMIHGLLHLAGYKDGTDEEKSVMRGKEDYYLDFGRTHNYFIGK
jgi:probable rRNA maturation factor